jgi:hypothetical protein
MDATCLPGQLPATVTRPRPLIEAVMAQSLREQGPASRTATAWRWVLTGQGPSPVSGNQGTGRPPGPDDITAEARHGSPPMSWPPWQNAFDRDPDRQQARRVLRWLTGAADAIPLLDLDRGRYVGARLYFARTDEELRQVRDWAHHGLRQCDLPTVMDRWDAEHPWRWPAGWMDAAWLRGAIAYLDWVLGDTPVTPITRRQQPVAQGPHPDPRVIAGQREMFGVGAGRYDIEEEAHLAQLGAQQGHENSGPVRPDIYPPPQWCEAVRQAHDWATGEEAKPPADRHGCGDYVACPGNCTCYDAGHCLHSLCPACTDRICNAGWATIVQSYDESGPAEKPHQQLDHPDGHEDQISLLDELRDMGWSAGG